MKKAIVVPIKTNNQRLPGKNTMDLGDKPLHDHLFDTLTQLDDIQIYVDSSDNDILKYVENKYNFKIIKRPPALNSPETSGNDLIDHALKYVDCDIFGQFFVTTPFLKSKTIVEAFNKFDDKEVDSCFGVYPVYDRFWLKDKPVNHTYNKLVGTQFMLNPLMREGGFYVFKSKTFKIERSRITKNHTCFEVNENECIDIDTINDFLYAEIMYKRGLV